jgi:molybdate transport system substrate-binding protein
MFRRSMRVMVLIVALASACAAPAPSSARNPTREPQTLTVFAAASLTDAFTEIGRDFEAAHPGVTVAFNFGGSQNLRTQLELGAVADVFASANQKEMEDAVTAGLVVSGAAQVFLTNQLIVILPPDNPGRVEKLEDLARTGLKLVLAAEDVPVGSYSRRVLEELETQFGAGFKDKTLANVVSNEDNVKQIVAKVQLGEADAGLVYGSDAVAAPELKTLAIPTGFNVIAQYPIAALARAPHPDLAQAFVDDVLSSAGQAVLKKWGFTPIH